MSKGLQELMQGVTAGLMGNFAGSVKSLGRIAASLYKTYKEEKHSPWFDKTNRIMGLTNSSFEMIKACLFLIEDDGSKDTQSKDDGTFPIFVDGSEDLTFYCI